MLSVEQIARVAHGVNSAYLEAQGQPQMSWEEIPDWHRAAVIEGVKLHLDNPTRTPEEIHQDWMEGRIAAGWKYGETVDLAESRHPNLRPYAELPESLRVRDRLLKAVVNNLGPKPSADGRLTLFIVIEDGIMGSVQLSVAPFDPPKEPTPAQVLANWIVGAVGQHMAAHEYEPQAGNFNNVIPASNH